MTIDTAKFKTKDGKIYPCKENLKPTKELLDSKGCGFCLAKWSQVTMHLGSGLNHSCHHVGAHKIPLNELANNPMALHNTSQKKQARKQMLNNERPSECDYCWRIEDNTQEYSDRIYKSLEPWSMRDIDKVINSNGDEDVYPRYVEVSFGNVCNFKCAYCGPPFSSKWTEEIKQHGAYNLLRSKYNDIKIDNQPIPHNKDNPYIDAFWKWFPKAVNHIKVLRITGGEPLLNKNTMKVLQFIIDNPQPGLELAINTNACVPNEVWRKFTALVDMLTFNKYVNKIKVFVSAESLGDQAEYSRDGMSWGEFASNIKELMNNSECELTFMSAFNVLSLPTYMDFLKFVNTIKTQNLGRVDLDIAYVRHPEFLDIKIATDTLIRQYLKPCVDYVSSNPNFTNWELQKITRILQDCEQRFNSNSKDDEININRYRFTQFVRQYDQRRNKNFLEIFPQMEDFWNICVKS